MNDTFASRWRITAVQIALLSGIGLAFAIGGAQEPAFAGGGPDCPMEGECTLKKPNVLFIMDYSTSMNEVWVAQNQLTRWQVTVDAVQTTTAPGSFLSQNTHLALMRFGHDPLPGVEGTTIPADTSGIVDGQAIDLRWDDEQDQWFECNGEALGASLDATPAPLDGNMFGIGTWTKGALDRAKAEIDETRAAHPEDLDGEPPRTYLNVVLTDGVWTGADGTTPLAPAEQAPGLTAAELFDVDAASTYVVALAGDPNAEAAADELALAGGTAEAIDGDTPELLMDALNNIVQDVIDNTFATVCTGGLPRIMVLLDASSSMLNVDGGAQAGAMGETGWDMARDTLAGGSSIFDTEVAGGFDAEDLSHIGLAVFGDELPRPGEQKILVDYNPCTKTNFAWALNPATSCTQPGCSDPWAGPPISWTFQEESLGEPGYSYPTRSHMPRCKGGGEGESACEGSGTYTHLGLGAIKTNQVAYALAAAEPNALYPADEGTVYVNVLITDGRYDGYSTDAQVEAELTEMYAAGIVTYIVGFGDGVDTPEAEAQLNLMAGWGSGGQGTYFDANSQAALSSAFVDIIQSINFEPCCAFNDCSIPIETGIEEPDPVPNLDETDTDTDTDSETDSETETSSESETDSETETGPESDGATIDGEEDTGSDDAEDSDDEVAGEDTAGDEVGPPIVGEPTGCECSAGAPEDQKPGPGEAFLGAVVLLTGLGLRRRRARA